MKTKTNIAILLVGSFLLLGIAIFTGARPSFAGSPPVAPAFSVATTSLAISVTTSTRILSTTTNPLAAPGVGTFTRSYASICNTSPTVPVLIRMDGDKPADGRTTGGYWINANGCYEVTDKMLYQGSITASTSDQTAVKVVVQDYVY